MVATKISELAGKGWEWAYGSGADGGLSSDSIADPTLSSAKSPSGYDVSAASTSYWDTASESISNAAEQTYSTVSNAMSSIYSYGVGSTPLEGPADIEASSNPLATPAANNSSDQVSQSIDEKFRMPLQSSFNRTSLSPSLAYQELIWSVFHNNPYISVRGGNTLHPHPPSSSSMLAVRSFLSVVPVDNAVDSSMHDAVSTSASESSSHPGDPILSEPQKRQPLDAFMGEQKTNISTTASALPSTSAPALMTSPSAESRSEGATSAVPAPASGTSSSSASSAAETASQLAEGTIRAFRDIALDEAVELHAALRYWNYRWERPFFSWLEAGPVVWCSKGGYQHQAVGQKVSHIQAVLAKRCAAIGDMQQHLLRAGWQRGVAQWGVLGDGGEWATVAGLPKQPQQEAKVRPAPLRRVSSEFSDLHQQTDPSHNERIHSDGFPSHSAPSSIVSKLPQRASHRSVRFHGISSKHNNDDGRITIDDSALAEWSVHAMAIVRQLMFRAGDGMVVLPFSENWTDMDEDLSLSLEGAGSSLAEISESPVLNPTEGFVEESPHSIFPIWANLLLNPTPMDVSFESTAREYQRQQQMTISDLPLLAAEVSQLLNVMHDVMQIQRARRLNKLKPPIWLRRNWYITTIALPSLSYMCYRMVAKGYGWVFAKYVVQKLGDFFREHVSDPLYAICTELLKGNENISDREARMITINSLKMMIRSWLDENYPNMPVTERANRAEAMDMSLIESKKEASMKTIFEINNVIRMSLIEAQFIKKEMMNALLALDKMQASNNINMNFAAVTPALILLYMAKGAFKLVFYATFKLGKSKEETYGSFLHILIEIERLLVMRDNPPTPPALCYDDHGRRQQTEEHVTSQGDGSSDCVLNADDLGMLMLHIHELRTILWRDGRRFSNDVIRSVVEDLSELAGERGAVSVRQQLQIISRMCRTYPFLKVDRSRIFYD